MPENWLVIDLRFNFCSIGLLSFSSDGEIRWEPRLLETYFHPLASPHSKDKIALSFFRKKGETYWNPIEIEIIEELTSDYEVINSLFNPQDSIGEKQYRQIMNKILKIPLKEFKDIPLLFLVDTEQSLNVMKGISKNINRKNEIILLTWEPVEYAGYALIETSKRILPDRNDKYICHIGRESEERRTVIFTWMGIGFQQEEAIHSDQLEISCWESMDEMDCVGAAMFALLWQPLLEERINVEMDDLADQISKKKELLKRMNNLINSLDVKINKQVSTI